jgi:DNA-binding LytR/AlgR family response regulator
MAQAMKLPALSCLILSSDNSLNSRIIRMSHTFPHLNVVGVCEQADNMYSAYTNSKPNLILWDKTMVNQEHIDQLKKLDSPPLVVLMSPNHEPTLELPDYLVATEIQHPFECDKFVEALQLVTEFQEEKEVQRLKQLKQPVSKFDVKLPQTVVPDYLFLRTDGRINRFNIEEILFFEGHGEFVVMKTIRGEFKLNMNMKRLGERLEHPLFLKTHRAFIINISKISHIEENQVYIGTSQILISRAQRGNVWERLNVF